VVWVLVSVNCHGEVFDSEGYGGEVVLSDEFDYDG
jgi:hypothetical protein